MGIQYRFIEHKICVTQLFMLSVWLPINTRLLVAKFWGTQKLFACFQLQGVSLPNTPTVQGSTIFSIRLIADSHWKPWRPEGGRLTQISDKQFFGIINNFFQCRLHVMFGTNLTGCPLFYVATLLKKSPWSFLNTDSWSAPKIMIRQLWGGAQEAALSPAPWVSRPHFRKHGWDSLKES